MYAQFPGQNSWELYYVIYKNCQLQFLSSIKSHAFRHCYVVHKLVTRKSQRYVSSVTEDEGGELRKIDVLLLTHDFDTEALYITHPLNF